MGKTKESLYVLSLDTKCRLLSVATVAEGSLAQLPFRAADIFRDPLICQATSIVLVHNHPSGDPTPSSDDRAITSQLVAAGRLLDIPIQDHVVVGRGRYVSFAEAGLL